MFSPRFLVFSVLLIACCTLPSQAAILVHKYELNGTLSDSLGGPALVSAGGTLSSSSYIFGANQGLSLSSGFTNIGNFSGDYSIVLDFRFDDLSGYKKITDFKDRGSDSGLYNLNSGLVFYNVTSPSSAVFSTTTEARLVLTRDGASNVVTGYVNGSSKWSFTDGSSVAVFTSANNIAQFFKDDFATSQGEATSGEVNRILIYQGALTAAEVAALPSPLPANDAVPEPASLLLWAAGLAAASIGYCRRPLVG